VDPITLLIEAVGVIILLMWIIIPIREFREILKRVKTRNAAASEVPLTREVSPTPSRGPHA
jgi:LytS/YehU family sensor histidine kinase